MHIDPNFPTNGNSLNIAMMQDFDNRTTEKTHKKQQRCETFRFWFSLIFSNSIALAALIVAILAYIKQ